MNNFSTNYEKILGILQQVEQKKNFLNQIRIPKLSDIELITIKYYGRIRNVNYSENFR